MPNRHRAAASHNSPVISPPSKLFYLDLFAHPPDAPLRQNSPALLFRGGAAQGDRFQRNTDHQRKPPKGQPLEGCCWACWFDSC